MKIAPLETTLYRISMAMSFLENLTLIIFIWFNQAESKLSSPVKNRISQERNKTFLRNKKILTRVKDGKLWEVVADETFEESLYAENIVLHASFRTCMLLCTFYEKACYFQPLNLIVEWFWEFGVHSNQQISNSINTW